MVSLEQIQMGIATYIEKEIASKATGLKKFGIYFMLPSIHKAVTTYIDNMYSLMPEFFDENKKIKLNEVYNQAKTAIQKTGQVEAMGIIFNETDIDKLYTFIKNTTI